jgi:hypothetical protein
MVEPSNLKYFIPFPVELCTAFFTLLAKHGAHAFLGHALGWYKKLSPIKGNLPFAQTLLFVNFVRKLEPATVFPKKPQNRDFTELVDIYLNPNSQYNQLVAKYMNRTPGNVYEKTKKYVKEDLFQVFKEAKKQMEQLKAAASGANAEQSSSSESKPIDEETQRMRQLYEQFNKAFHSFSEEMTTEDKERFEKFKGKLDVSEPVDDTMDGLEENIELPEEFTKKSGK